ncbi:MAG: 23S rRNA (adenine(2030)-N(6))-methyltransferase RlmJ [Alphaproteobacteria bacterium]
MRQGIGPTDGSIFKILSYLHSFHAGNLADLHKHAALARLLVHMTAKPRAISYLESHAGRGLYDLSGPEAEKTAEAAEGILAQADEADGTSLPAPYAAAVAAVRARYGPNFYPGSPWIARHILRDQDVLHLMELHPAEFPALKRNLRADNVHCHRRDGLEGLLALSPPTPRRGLVLIDPSYEVKDDYARVAATVAALYRKWPQAVTLIWYPILRDGRHETMVDRILAADPPDPVRDEVSFPDPENRRGMTGSGLLLIGCPFGFRLNEAE